MNKPPYTSGKAVLPLRAFGSIQGTVDTLSRRYGLKFVIYDDLFDRAVYCFLKRGQEDRVRDFWGEKVIVSGTVYRYAENGKPYQIRDIISIHALQTRPPGSYKNAAGVLKLRDGETPVSVVRSFRDAE